MKSPTQPQAIDFDSAKLQRLGFGQIPPLLARPASLAQLRQQMSQQLQTSLEPQRILGLFFRELQRLVPLDALVYQHAASDLRLVIAVTKAITDLERIGDEATKIARQAIAMNKDGLSPRGYIEVRHIGGHVSRMLQDALDAFARLDMQLALTVVQTDKQVDMEYSTAMRELVTFMIEDPRSITRVLNIMWSLRALERIGDHARNLAQYVIYLVNGEDVRHANLEQITENVNAKEE